MFEFQDSKIGKVKVVNITEARSQMANIMSDKNFNYIVTKNNKPVRVIINYSTFRDKQLGSKITKAAQPDLSANQIKGLLDSQQMEIEKQDQVDQKPSSPRKQTKDSKKIQASKTRSKTPPPPVPVEAESEPEASEKDNYYSRFKKLYESPQTASQKTKTTTPPKPQADEMISEPPEPSQNIFEDNEFELSDQDPLDETPAATTSPSQEPPSIQDLLGELEGEKLGPKEDDLDKLLNKLGNK